MSKKHLHKYKQIDYTGKYPDYSKWSHKDAVIDIVVPQIRTSKRVLLCETCGDIKEVIKVHDEELTLAQHINTRT